MNFLSLDFGIVVASLVITYIIGLRAGRGVSTIRDYAIANKKFGTGALVLTWLATNIEGNKVVGIAGMVASEGIIPSVALLGLSVSYLITGYCFRKIVYFTDCYTIGDVINKLYGKAGGILSGLCCLACGICLINMQLSILGNVCDFFFL